MAEPTRTLRCARCGLELAPSFLSCPACHGLVHAGELKRLAAEAEAATQRADLPQALAAWRQASELLPPDSRQAQIVDAHVAELSRRIDATSPAARPRMPAPRRASGKWGLVAGVGTVAVLLWKFKFALAFVLGKGKLLLTGLTKGSTFFSMILSLGVYWATWGWKFALGLVISIYIHEMGHVAALRRYGIKATAPMFLPGLGAVIRLKQYPAAPREDARVGLAGPLWGLAAAVGTYAVHLLTGWGSWAAIARVAAWINLFNLLPIWQLDGSRGFRALGRWQRWVLAGAFGVMWLLTGEGLLVLLLLVSALRAIGERPITPGDRSLFLQFLLLVVALSAMCRIPVAGAGP